MLSLHNVTYHYQDTDTPYTYHLQVKNGEIYHLKGQNGTGKSTILNLIAGILSPHSGTISYRGKSFQGLAFQERPLAYMMQNQPYFAHLTIKQTFALTKMTTDQWQEALEFFHLYDQHKKLSDLSGGQRQIVLFLQTLLLGRNIILLDEPFSHLDAHNTQKALHYLRTHLHNTKSLCLIAHHGDV